jgi:hypothetical protein
MNQEATPPREQGPAYHFTVVSAEEYIQQRDQLEQDLFAYLTAHTREYYEEHGTKLFLSEDKQSGFGINPDGELLSVFALERGRGRVLVAEAKRQGATYLSCIGNHLLNLYAEIGFAPVEVLTWDNRFAPKNWNYERFGTPNIYEMRLKKE